MSKTVALAAISLIAGTLTAAAASPSPQISGAPPNEWRGVAYLTAVAGCPANSYSVNNMLRFRFSPASLGTNDTKSRLSFFQDYFGISYVTTGTFFGAAAVTASSGYTGGGTTGTATNVPTIKLVLDAPTSLTTTSMSIALHGTITNFYDSAGCTVSFRATGSKRP